MTGEVLWRRARLAEVPSDDDWLTDEERAVLAGLVVAKRRADWRLGRWAAKAVVGAVYSLGDCVCRVSIRAAADGAPEPLVDGVPVDWSLSLSHRDGMAVAALSALPMRVGIDLEVSEPRSDAFIAEWLSDEERAALPPNGRDRQLRVLCSWTGKEASAKARREGLRLAVRRAVVVPSADLGGGWARLTVTWRTEGLQHGGWWRCEDRWIMAVVTDSPSGPPVPA